MKFKIDFEKVYKHPIDKVWNAITNREILGEWLMETTFTPEKDCEFEMWCNDGKGGTDTYICKVLEINSPSSMLWSWVLDGRQENGVTYVRFNLEEVPGGTKLSIQHSGDRDPETIEKFKGGWPVKLDHLETAI